MIVFSYLRVSSQGQIEGDGFPRQREAVRRFCNTHSLTLEKEFCEQVSGTVDVMSREKFVEMLSEIEQRSYTDNPIKGIVVERLDRLARDLTIGELLLAECRKRNILVFSADQGVLVDAASNDGDPTRTLVRQILGAVAEYQKTELVAKLKAARHRMKLQKGYCEGNKPYGITNVEQTIKEVINTYISDGHSLSRVADMLNASGFTTRRGTPWSKGSVFNVHTGRRRKQAVHQ